MPGMSVDPTPTTPDSGRRQTISPHTVRRLSYYLRSLEELAARRQSTVSSRQLADALGLTAAQVRKDLAYFGQFGRPGVGYGVPGLVEHLRAIFGTDKTWNVAVVGAGNLGGALLRYKGFTPKGFRVVAAFDAAPGKTGKRFGDLLVQPMSELAATIEARQIRLVLLAVPAEAAQEVADQLCRAGVKGILNFTPVNLATPPEVAVVPVDLAVQLEQLSYLVNAPLPRQHGAIKGR